MRPKAILLIYGEGGHKSQMSRLFELFKDSVPFGKFEFLGVCENNHEIDGIVNYSLSPFRDKYSYSRSVINLPHRIFTYFSLLFFLVRHFHIVGIISTGPGIVVIPSIFFKLLGVPIVYIETWSRFCTQSLSGKVMYRLSNRFYVQNIEQLKYYKNGIYGGLL